VEPDGVPREHDLVDRDEEQAPTLSIGRAPGCPCRPPRRSGHRV